MGILNGTLETESKASGDGMSCTCRRKLQFAFAYDRVLVDMHILNLRILLALDFILRRALDLPIMKPKCSVLKNGHLPTYLSHVDAVSTSIRIYWSRQYISSRPLAG